MEELEAAPTQQKTDMHKRSYEKYRPSNVVLHEKHKSISYSRVCI